MSLTSGSLLCSGKMFLHHYLRHSCHLFFLLSFFSLVSYYCLLYHLYLLIDLVYLSTWCVFSFFQFLFSFTPANSYKADMVLSTSFDLSTLFSEVSSEYYYIIASTPALLYSSRLGIYPSASSDRVAFIESDNFTLSFIFYTGDSESKEPNGGSQIS